MEKVKVILLRGKKETLQWEHPSLKSAMRRATALADLHSTNVSTDKSYELTVDASNYYGKE